MYRIHIHGIERAAGWAPQSSDLAEWRRYYGRCRSIRRRAEWLAMAASSVAYWTARRQLRSSRDAAASVAAQAAREAIESLDLWPASSTPWQFALLAANERMAVSPVRAGEWLVAGTPVPYIGTIYAGEDHDPKVRGYCAVLNGRALPDTRHHDARMVDRAVTIGQRAADRLAA